MSDRSKAGPRPLSVPSGRLSRLARMGSLTAGVAGSMALNGAAAAARGERPSFRGLLLTPANVTRIAEQLARMRGAAMKVGQLVSMDAGEVLPPELSRIMARLREDAHFMPPEQLRRVLDAEWGAGWRGRFASFDPRPIAAASIGQVHRAALKDGRALAIKVQYPGVARSIDSDVANVGALIRMAGLAPPGIDLAPYLKAAAAQLHEETDYEREAEQLARFRARLAGDDRFVLPEPVAALTTGRVLAMTYVAGEPIESAEALPQAARDRIAAALVDLTLAELLDFGEMQTDPNFANYRLEAETGRIVLLDFGAARPIAPEVADGYRRLFDAGRRADAAGIAEACGTLGLAGAEIAPEHRETLLRMIGEVFEEMRAAEVFDFAATDLPARMQAQGMALAEDGFAPPPPPMDVLYVQRKFGGMFLLCSRLRARVPVQALLAARLDGQARAEGAAA